jgi:hypothetical protein
MANRRPRRTGPARMQGVAADGRSRVPGEASPTAIALEALRTGVLPPTTRARHHEIPHDESILAGDPDDHALANEYVGEETPGGTASTPDQNGVDEIGRAYGLQEEDSGALRSSYEVLHRRDVKRFELRPPGRRQP